MSDALQRLAELDEMTSKGEILDALAAYYDEACSFIELADGSRRDSRAEQHEHLAGFFASLSDFNGATLHSSAMGNDTSLSEWTFDMTAGDGSSIVWNEVLVRRWRNGRVVEERFYNP